MVTDRRQEVLGACTESAGSRYGQEAELYFYVSLGDLLRNFKRGVT